MLKTSSTKRSTTIFLQGVIVLIGIGTIIFLLWEPHIEGRNINSTLFQIYFNDPFLAYAYTASIAFFIALYQAFKLLGNIKRDEVFSQSSLKALRTIKYCCMTTIGFILPAVAYLFIVRPEDDIAGGIFMGILVFFISIVFATVASVFEKILQSAIDIKSANNLQI